MWNLRITAFCLMPNHYHILAQTPDANLSRGMRHLNGVYTQRFNRRHSSDGQLFRGRYKSILISADSYLLEVVKYIHRNPHKAGLSKGIDDYPWSSHKGYLSNLKKWGWLHNEIIYTMLTQNRSEWFRRYKKFVSTEDDGGIGKILESSKKPSILGPKDFVDWIKEKYYKGKLDSEITESRELAPEKDLIIRKVCEFYNVSVEEVYKSKRGQQNEPRNMAVFLIRMLRHDTLNQIGEYFQMDKYSSVSSIIERMRKQMQIDRKLKTRFEALSNNFIKSQEQT